MRVWSIFMRVKRKRSAMIFNSPSVRSHSSSWRSANALIDQFGDQLLDFLRSRFLEAARGAFHHVGQADDRALPRLRFRAAVAKTLLPHLRNVVLAHLHDLAAGARILVLLQGALVKIIDERSAVMLLDDVDDLLIEPVFEREVNAFLHVRDDDERAHRRREIVVRIALEVHVLGEIFRLHQFADIVEIGADAAERGVRADRFGGGFGEVRDDQTVMIGAGRFDRHPAQERMIQIGRFQPGNIGRDLEELFEDRQRAADDSGGHDAVADSERALDSDHRPIVRRRIKPD